MEILVIDGQGGGLGRQLVAAVKKAVPQAVVTAIGTNSAATSAMLKAGHQLQHNARQRGLTALPPARTPWWWAAAGRMSFWGPSAL